ncbi:VCBS repeat-containing protein [Aliiroseovarius subalbicans]|uniref:FG-GAP repeat domain-containing protein n=1 Tax=Aliiroseovarius subalbicans TaxID=2925840 RepID=UPI001F5731B0|nr:VCBS repeat-containing protein [Aliiroseovarius subalbicans]MCI2400489.1 VCBS repeat-containing protein [Aliiroseovarius subalbicans]
MRRLAAFLTAIWAGAAWATPPDIITEAQYAEPTTRYAHGVLGDDVEWGALVLTVDRCLDCATKMIDRVVIRLPETRVFEDLAPRLFVDDDGATQVAVVESDRDRGARLAIYDETGLVTATPFIGQANRWLAPVGIADLDGDGFVEIAYVDRPHLAKVLRVWRLAGRELREVASAPGISNHRIGEDFISGGMRDCGAGPEMIVASGDWREVMAVGFDGKALSSNRVGPFEGRDSFAAALACKD